MPVPPSFHPSTASMAPLTSAQRNLIYRQAAVRTGIHKPILAALYEVHRQPLLSEGETGLGISPANRISLNQVNTFADQVTYAANTLRSLTNHLVDTGWTAADLWDIEQGCYTDQFIIAIATGYTAPASDPTAAILESSDGKALTQVYQADLATDFATVKVPIKGRLLEEALLTFVKQLFPSYLGFPFQRNALLEMVRIWLKLDDRKATLAALEAQSADDPNVPTTAPSYLDLALRQVIPRLVKGYAGYPHQREALLRLTQLWRQLDSRESAIVSLGENTSPEIDLTLIDPALIAFVQRLPQSYQARGEQRNALVEGFRLWQQLETRSAALMALGVNPEIFTAADPQQSDLQSAAIHLDRTLIEFIRSVPVAYEKVDQQREALLHLTQLWRKLATRNQTIQSLLEDFKRMQAANRDSQEASPLPTAIILPSRPDRWSPDNIQLFAAILPNGSFTWAEATHGGTNLPANQRVVDAIVGMAYEFQQIRDRLGRRLQIVRWYQPLNANSKPHPISDHRHALGEAIDFYCEGFTGDQLYWFLDPWWTGGLGRYQHFPYLIYIDARGDRVR
ncbi:MAG: peptidase M15A [Kovacikia sp.]